MCSLLEHSGGSPLNFDLSDTPFRDQTGAEGQW